MIATFIILASITFIAMMSPGPDMMLVIKYSGAKERWPVLVCIIGICCGVIVHVALSILGIAAIIAASTTIYSIFKLAGAAYLIYIGIQSLRSGLNSGLSDDASSKACLSFDNTIASGIRRYRAAFLDGLLCNVLNPKVTLFIIAVFTQVIEPTTPVVEKVFYGLFLAFEAFVVWYIFSALVRTRLILGLMQRFQAAINRVVGVMLIGFGGALALDESR